METNLTSNLISADIDPAVAAKTQDVQSGPATVSKTSLIQIVVVVLGAIVFLYFARPVVLPIFLAVVAAMTLKPLIRWLSYCHMPPTLSATVVMGFLLAAIGIGFFQLGRPALMWMNEAPQHMNELRQRGQKIFPRIAGFNEAAAAMDNLGATEAERKTEQQKSPTVEVKQSRGTSSILNWTGTFLVGIGETLVLIYLLLASSDLFLLKLVHVMPTLHDKKRVVEISHEIQQNISNYLFSVSLINIGVGVIVSGGLYFMGVPNAAMWGMLAAVLNFIPYFGPISGVILLGIVGLLTFDTVSQGLLPPALYLLLHFVEANLVTPVLLGHRFTLNPVVIFVSLIFWMWLLGGSRAFFFSPL